VTRADPRTTPPSGLQGAPELPPRVQSVVDRRRSRAYFSRPVKAFFVPRSIPERVEVARAILLGIVAAVSPAAADDIALRVAYDPASKEARLSWNGGASPYSMFRSSSPIDLERMANLVGQTPLQDWSDPTPRRPSSIIRWQRVRPLRPRELRERPSSLLRVRIGRFRARRHDLDAGSFERWPVDVSGTTGLPIMTGPQVPTCPTGSFSASAHGHRRLLRGV